MVGIVPQDVGFSREVDLWVPLAADIATEGRGDKRLAVVGRLAAGVTSDEAQAELAAVAGALAHEFPADNGGWSARLEPVFDWIVGDDLPQRIRLLVIAVGLLLLVACANVANLQMARAAGRTGELGVRLALGANRARLLRQTLTEGFLLASWGRARPGARVGAGQRQPRRAARLHPASRRPVDQPAGARRRTAVDARGRARLRPAPGADGRSGRYPRRVAARGTAGQHGARAPIRPALVGVQLALSTALVVGAALLLQSTWNMEGQALGFRAPERLLTANISRPQRQDFKLDRDVAFYDAVLREAAVCPVSCRWRCRAESRSLTGTRG